MLEETLFKSLLHFGHLCHRCKLFWIIIVIFVVSLTRAEDFDDLVSNTLNSLVFVVIIFVLRVVAVVLEEKVIHISVHFLFKRLRVDTREDNILVLFDTKEGFFVEEALQLHVVVG